MIFALLDNLNASTCSQKLQHFQKLLFASLSYLNFTVDKLGGWIRTIHIGQERRHATLFTEIPRESEKQDVTNY